MSSDRPVPKAMRVLIERKTPGKKSGERLAVDKCLDAAAQNALAAFLEIDADMIAAAAIGSAESCDRPTESVDAWLQSLSPDELRSILKSIVRVAYRGRALAAMTDDSDPRTCAPRTYAWSRCWSRTASNGDRVQPSMCSPPLRR